MDLCSHFKYIYQINHSPKRILKVLFTRLRMGTLGSSSKIRRIWCCWSTFLTLLDVFFAGEQLCKWWVKATAQLIDQVGGRYCSQLQGVWNDCSSLAAVDIIFSKSFKEWHTCWRINCRCTITTIKEIDLWFSLIIGRISVKWETTKTCFYIYN